MTKKIFICLAVAIVAACAGYFTCLKVNTDSIESAKFKTELLDVQEKALEKSHKIMEKHDIYDLDGSDDMADYLELCNKADMMLGSQL